MKKNNKKIVIFASGSGSNAVKIFDYFKGKDNVNIDCLYCNNPGAKVLKTFKRLNIKTVLFSKTDYEFERYTEFWFKQKNLKKFN